MARALLLIFLVIRLTACEDEVEKKAPITINSLERSIHESTKDKDYLVANKTFNTGGGTGGFFVTFEDDRTFRTYGFCDICPGGGSMGTYVQKSKEILLLDTICFESKPHFTDPEVNVPCTGPTMTSYYIVIQKNYVYLSSNPKDTLNPEEAQIDGSFPRFEIVDYKKLDELNYYQ